MAAVLTELRSDGIAVIRLNRPEKRNALDTATLSALNRALSDLAAAADVHVLILSTTSIRALCAGADIGETLDDAGALRRAQAFADLYAGVEAFPVPTIAVCVGHCVGAGAEIAAGVDLRVGGDNLAMAWAGARLGVPVGPARLAPLVGLARAKELVFTGRVLDAAAADEFGLLHRVAPATQAEAAALELATAVAAQPADGLRRLKALFRDLDGSAERVGRENTGLVEFQRSGAGLPRRR